MTLPELLLYNSNIQLKLLKLALLIDQGPAAKTESSEMRAAFFSSLGISLNIYVSDLESQNKFTDTSK